MHFVVIHYSHFFVVIKIYFKSNAQIAEKGISGLLVSKFSMQDTLGPRYRDRVLDARVFSPLTPFLNLFYASAWLYYGHKCTIFLSLRQFSNAWSDQRTVQSCAGEMAMAHQLLWILKFIENKAKYNCFFLHNYKVTFSERLMRRKKSWWHDDITALTKRWSGMLKGIELFSRLSFHTFNFTPSTLCIHFTL